MDTPGSKLSTTCLLFQHHNSMPLGLIGGGHLPGGRVSPLPHPTPFPWGLSHYCVLIVR